MEREKTARTIATSVPATNACEAFTYVCVDDVWAVMRSQEHSQCEEAWSNAFMQTARSSGEKVNSHHTYHNLLFEAAALVKS
eukprot:scaffold140900_cov18-Prasinocladus_malaysianus.AAC.1